ncbi:MAG: threonine ammonia-lyase [Planctomycetota bacterium]
MPVTIDDVRAATERVREAVLRTPCHQSDALARLCGCTVYAKLDYLQATGSFKERGARNKLAQLGNDAGVIAASAGNHAQALAYHGRDLGHDVTVVMPKFAPLVKVANCRALGARVVIHGSTFDEARRHAVEIAERDALTYVHGFDDPAIVAGAGTTALEILEDVPEPDAVIVPVGGGGLISGVGLVMKALAPNCRLIGVEADSAPTLQAALAHGGPTPVEVTPTIADGLAIAQLGQLNYDICKGVVDQVVSVDEAQTARAVLQLMEKEKAVVEGAAATSLAALTGPLCEELAGRTVVILLCGGNVDASVLARVIERGLAADGRLCRFVCRTSDRPGSLAKLLNILGEVGVSVKDVQHDRSFGPPDIGRVDIALTLETYDADHIEQLRAALKANGIAHTQLSHLGEPVD